MESSLYRIQHNSSPPACSKGLNLLFRYLKVAKMKVPTSFIHQICTEFSNGIHFAAPLPSLRTNEAQLVCNVLQILQGYTTSIFYWDNSAHVYRATTGIHVDHLSHSSLCMILNQFCYAGSCLKLVEITLNTLENSVRLCPPTLTAFAFSVSEWLRKLRDIALNEEAGILKPGVQVQTVPTLMEISNSLSSLCSGSECLLQLVEEAIPKAIFENHNFLSAAEIAVFVLDHLYKKLNDACIVQGGEEEAYQMLLYIFAGTILPYVEVLDSWLYEGTLHDTYEEIFFYPNESISVDAAEFWNRSYLVRTVNNQKASDLIGMKSISNRASLKLGDNATSGSHSTSSLNTAKEHDNRDSEVCPLFLKDIAQSIISTGKSVQLIRHISSRLPFRNEMENDGRGVNGRIYKASISEVTDRNVTLPGLTLAEVFIVSLVGLASQGDHVSSIFCGEEIKPSSEPCQSTLKVVNEFRTSLASSTFAEKIWYKLLIEAFSLEKENIA